jgi:hypothetical protein
MQNTQKKIPHCDSCNIDFKNWGELADHIILNKVDHRRGLKWAASYKLKVNFLNKKKDAPEGRIALTEEEKEAKIDSQRTLSGQTDKAKIICPHCRSQFVDKIATEHATNPLAWKTKSNEFLINCSNCASKFHASKPKIYV